MKLSVVIVSYNVRNYLEQCLQSVQRALEGIEGEVFVVDNHSDDDSVVTVREKYPWVRLIENQENLGFSKANNQAIRQSQADYVLLLNPAGVMMCYEDGSRAPESRRALPTPWVAALKMLGFTKRYYMSHLPWDQPCRIEVISGAFCLLRHEALKKIGLLDEDFFMYGEDIDLSYRLLKGGWENWYLPYSIIHYKGKSTQKSDYRYVHVFYQAMLIFFQKHYSHLSMVYTVPVKMAIYFRAFIALTDILRKKLHL